MTRSIIDRVVFNKSINSNGEIRFSDYRIGVVSRYQYKVPVSITLEDGWVIIEFEDKTRHLMPVKDVEIFDKIIETADGENKPKKRRLGKKKVEPVQ